MSVKVARRELANDLFLSRAFGFLSLFLSLSQNAVLLLQNVLCHFGLFLFGELSFIFLFCDTDWFIYGNKTWVQNLDGTWKLSWNIN